jgi:hypothetical protein
MVEFTMFEFECLLIKIFIPKKALDNDVYLLRLGSIENFQIKTPRNLNGYLDIFMHGE